MTLMMEAEEQVQQQPLTRGLSGIFARKKSKAGQSLFDAEGDALDAFGSLPTSGVHIAAAARPPSPSRRGWGGILRRNSSAAPGEAAAAAEAEMVALRERCAAQEHRLVVQGAQLAAARAAEQDARERLNMQRFKYELLVDLWAVRVLDNEELGAQEPAPAP